MRSKVESTAVRKITTIALLAAMSTGVVISGNTPASVKAANQETKAKPAKMVVAYPNLHRYGRDLTRLARLGRLEPMTGHETEIARVVETLAEATKTPVLIGESNLDRAAIARGFAFKVASGDVPLSLRGKLVFSLSLDAIAARAKTSQEFENRITAIIAEAEKANGQIILFIDELQEVAGKRATHVSSTALQTALRNKNLAVVGAASRESYVQYISADETIASLFESIEIRGIASTDSENPEQSTFAKTEQFEGDKISSDMRELANSVQPNQRVSAILQVDDTNSPKLKALFKRYGITVSDHMSQLKTMKIELPAGALEDLAASGLTNYISPDVQLDSFGHVTSTTGADLVRLQLGTSYTGYLDGSGIGIAVLDSGVDTAHRAFDKNIKFNKDFTTENLPNNDPYGHGTHVASAAAGISAVSGNSYQGIAPGANIINLRVLNAQGVGSTSSLLNALNWFLVPVDPTKPVSSNNPLNKDKYNVRVVNLSLGAPAISSYKNDPVCRAARALVNAGIVVVAAAGNNGKAADGTKLYGKIHSPGTILP